MTRLGWRYHIRFICRSHLQDIFVLRSVIPREDAIRVVYLAALPYLYICVHNRDTHLEFRRGLARRKKRERAITEMRHIIAVRGTLSRRLTECKCTSGISRFNHDRVYICATLLFLATLRYVVDDILRTARDQRQFTFLSMFKNQRGEMCAVMPVTKKRG